MKKLDITTSSVVEFQDITRMVEQSVAESGITGGMCYVFVPHTTAAVTVNEHADPDVVRDIIAELERIVPQHGGYRHAEGNSPAHIKAALLGDSETLIVENGRIVLGTWQGVFFCEFDGPRRRQVYVKVMSD